MNLSKYIKKLDRSVEKDERQKKWYGKLASTVEQGLEIYESAGKDLQDRLSLDFNNRVRTEEIKAWYSTPENNSLFQGTSISSLTIPCELKKPLQLESIEDLEEAIADNYIRSHEKYAETVRSAILENVDQWISEGLYYGVVIASKVISQAFNFSAVYENVILKIGEHKVDPHEITTYSDEVREEYFKKAAERLTCFEDLKLSQEEIEASLILADISKPLLSKYRSKILLAPIRCNEIAACLAQRVKGLIIERSKGKICPRSLAVMIYDTDTPYTYQQVIRGNGDQRAPVLPGLTVLGASGSIDALRWLYTYRLSLITQKIQKSSLYSQVHSKFIPFVFYGVLVPRDAEILLNMNDLDLLRYRGNLSPHIEFPYLVPMLNKYNGRTEKLDLKKIIKQRSQ